MKKILLVASIALGVGITQGAIIDFNSKSPVAGGYYRPTVDGDYDWSDGGADFNMNVAFNGAGWTGFTYSDVEDTTTVGYLNQYAVYGDGKGYGSTGAYGVGYYSSFGGVTPTITFSSAQTVNSLYLNNTTYAALDMQLGGDFSDPFTTNDWLKVTIEGKNGSGISQGTVEFDLADFTGYTDGADAESFMVTDWAEVDLSGLGSDVLSLEFVVSASTSGVPTYFAIDQIDAIPEPSTVILMAGGFGGLVWFRRRRKYFFHG